MKIDELLKVMEKLRDPASGCPWDLKQTYSTIVPYTIEEAYEVAEAIENKDYDELKLELGDLLFQVVFYAQLAREEKRFNFSDVVTAIVKKMIRRHPHVFSDTVYKDDAEFAKAWEQSKREEKTQNGQQVSSYLDGVVKSLPALKVAQKMQKKAARAGFDWQSTTPVYEKIQEEISEVREAEALSEHSKIEDEIGDLLFSVVNLSRHLKVDAEEALRKASNKFERRFKQVEAASGESGRQLDHYQEQELIELWEQVKRSE